jgi:hypothetical protein
VNRGGAKDRKSIDHQDHQGHQANSVAITPGSVRHLGALGGEIFTIIPILRAFILILRAFVVKYFYIFKDLRKKTWHG